MDYGVILRRAWEITWKHRALWLFGLLASLTSNSNLNSNLVRDSLTDQQRLWLLRFMSSPAILGFILLMIVIGLGLELLASMGRAGMIDQVNRLEESGSYPTVPAGWRAGKKYAGRVFAIAILLSLPAVIAILSGLLPIIIPWMRTIAGAGGLRDMNWRRIGGQLLAFFPPMCCAAFILTVFLGMIKELAERVCVLENRSVWSSIKGAFALLRDRTGPVLATWLILAGITIGLFIVLAVPMCMLILFASLPLRLMRGYGAARIAASGFMVILLWLVVVAIGSVTRPFFSSAWTLSYRGMQQPPPAGDAPLKVSTTDEQEVNE